MDVAFSVVETKDLGKWQCNVWFSIEALFGFIRGPRNSSSMVGMSFWSSSPVFGYCRVYFCAVDMHCSRISDITDWTSLGLYSCTAPSRAAAIWYLDGTKPGQGRTCRIPFLTHCTGTLIKLLALALPVSFRVSGYACVNYSSQVEGSCLIIESRTPPEYNGV